ncbi:aspartate aminotransferase family protein [Poseidonocella sp. HB161398]|uniref:aspartate aminotransferase family protein n=1 Tax=Poseidonocella sp. HB161398 TaxID=2320855 RepID=UPI001980D3A3|nr:aspartate aminotransferase family protein [Poseidonocella sp. HB161398]
MSGADLMARREAVLGPAYRLFYDEPLHLVRGRGAEVWDREGRRYLDAYNNVPSVGHCHPRVVAALAEQAGALNTHTRYLHENVVAYAERLVGTLPPELGQVMLTCTGSEANDLALRVARCATGGTGVIVTAHAYHGVTLALAEMSPSLGAGAPLGRHVRTIPAPDAFRLADPGQAMAAAAEAAVDSLAAEGIRPAAILFDTVFASDGLHPGTPGIYAGAVEAVRRAGGLFIADEVQSGLGRPGGSMWAFERHGLVPDIVTMGKPLGGGHPLAAMAARPDLLERFGRETRYFNTFGGNPVSAAVGLAVLDVIRDEGLMQRAEATGRQLLDGLRQIAAGRAGIGDVRGAGLYATLEVVSAPSGRPDGPRAAALQNRLRQLGILAGLCGAENQCLKLRPPLCFSDRDCDELLSGLDRALST